MSSFDQVYARSVAQRLRGLSPEETPGWGTLTPAGMVHHLADLVRYSMGRTEDRPFEGSWVSRNVAGPLILRGILRMPRNVRTNTPMAAPAELGTLAAEIEALQGLLEEYLAAVEAGEFAAKCHPYFGEIGVDGWARCHVAHFEHHLRQFGV